MARRRNTCNAIYLGENALLKKCKNRCLDASVLDEQSISMLIIQFWCKDGHYIWQIQGNVPEIYMQSLCKLIYMPLEIAVGLYISPQIYIDIILPKHTLVHISNHPRTFWGAFYVIFAITSHAYTSRQPCLFSDRLNNYKLVKKKVNFFKEDFFLNIFFN